MMNSMNKIIENSKKKNTNYSVIKIPKTDVSFLYKNDKYCINIK